MDFDEYRNYLKLKVKVPEKQISYYLGWVTQFFASCNKHPGQRFDPKEVSEFIEKLSQRCEDWQVDQAKKAIELFRYLQNRENDHQQKNNHVLSSEDWKKAADTLVKRLRLKQRSYRTEKTYVNWLRGFYRFIGCVPPDAITDQHLTDYLTYLAVERNVAKATQSQAFNALLFFYRNVLGRDPGDIRDTIRAKPKRRLPVVLTRSEVSGLLAHLSGVPLLMAQVIYGGGLRLQECVSLRIKDVDFQQNILSVRGKGDKDRRTLLADAVIKPLQARLEQVRELFEADRQAGVSGVYLPNALSRKYPNAGKEWIWQWVFPSHTLSVDPRTQMVRRHHLHPTSLQKQTRLAQVGPDS
jgi:integron integrase